MAKTLPPMMQVMRDIGGIELPESLVKLGGDDNGTAVAEVAAEPEAIITPSPLLRPATQSALAMRGRQHRVIRSWRRRRIVE